ncbi:hypothetical protein KSS87_001984 [Heliosperma pusillum]|nr:hypothetical protein KSS87_001984 [Heliosperma pusillum]
MATSSSATASPSSTSSKVAYDDDDADDDDDVVCRICRNPGDADNPLRLMSMEEERSFSILIQDLSWNLEMWNAISAVHVCKHPFAFSPVYAENAPSRLPFQEFVVGIGKRTCHVLKFFLRLSFVLSVWLLIIPFITFWIWRLAFVRSFSEANRLFLSHMSSTLILTDCLHGFLLSASIVFIFLGASSLRDYFRHWRELGGQDAEREDEGDRNRARAVRRPVVHGNRDLAAGVNVDDAGGAQEIAGAGQMIRRNAENVAAHWQRQAARLEAHVELMFDGLDDADGAEDVPFDELVGMQGPVFHLVENAFTVLASNMIFLGFVMFLPFSLGQLILHYVARLFISATNSAPSTVTPLAGTALSLANITLKNALAAVTILTSDNLESNLVDQIGDMGLNASALSLSPNSSTLLSSDILDGMVTGTSRYSDVTTLVVGYLFLFSLIFLYFGMFTLVKYARGDPLTTGRFQGLVAILEAIPSLLQQFFACMRHLMTMIKVAFLLVVERGVFPLMCGWWLDVCTVRMFGKSMVQRVEFFLVSPLASSLVHWVVGICYMLQISIFVSLLRGVLRSGVLYFIRDPADPNYNSFRDLIDDPVHKHARRVLLSVAVYGSLIVMLVFLPVKHAMRMAPSLFPIDISVADPFTEIPTGILVFQICLPFAIEHFELKTTIKSVLRHWFTAVGRALSLTDYLLPQPEDTIAQDNGADAGRRDRLPGQRLGVVAQLNQGQFSLHLDVPNDIAHGSENSDMTDGYDGEEQSDSERYGFVFRIVLLLVVAWMTLLVFNSALVVIPVSIGRIIFNSIPPLPMTDDMKCNDLYAFAIGSYLIWMAIAGVSNHNFDELTSLICEELEVNRSEFGLDIKMKYPNARGYKVLSLNNDKSLKALWASVYQMNASSMDLYISLIPIQQPRNLFTNMLNQAMRGENPLLSAPFSSNSVDQEQYDLNSNDDEIDEDENELLMNESDDECEDLVTPSAPTIEFSRVPSIDLEYVNRWCGKVDVPCYDGGEFLVGQRFNNKLGLSQYVHQYHIERNQTFKTTESKPLTVTFKCSRKPSPCDWTLRASNKEASNDSFTIVTYKGPHNTSCVVDAPPLDHPNLSNGFIAKHIRTVVDADWGVKISNLRANILTQFNFEPSYMKTWHAKQKAMADLYGDWKGSYALVPRYLQALKTTNPGTVVKFAYKVGGPSNVRVFDRVFWAFGPSIRGFEHCRPILTVDGTHLYGKYKGVLLIAIGVDANDQIYPLAFAIVDCESIDTWGGFMDCIRKHVTQREGICVISDRHVGIMTAMNKVGGGWTEPQAFHRFCTRHQASNINTKFKSNELKLAFLSTACAAQRKRFNKGMQKIGSLNPSAKVLLKIIPLSKWSLCHDGGHRYGIKTTNNSECFNGVLKRVRFLPITALVKATFFRINSYFVKHREDANKRLLEGCMWSEKVTEKLAENVKRTAHHKVTCYDARRGLYEVVTGRGNRLGSEGNHGHTVILSDRTCTCNKWQIYHIPCSHVMAVCRANSTV